jgi:hypothetical protein
VTWDDAARYAPLVTATVAVLALMVAFGSIHAQRKIARRRAAIDFFLKAEMDDKMMTAFASIEASVIEFRKAPSVHEFCETEDYKKIRTYLIILELMAVGIHNKTFDQRICYDFWADVVSRAHNDTRPLINHIRSNPGCAATYDDLIRLNNRWNGHRWIWQWWRSRWWPLRME